MIENVSVVAEGDLEWADSVTVKPLAALLQWIIVKVRQDLTNTPQVTILFVI